MFKVGDEVCFVSKSAGAMKIKGVNESIKMNVLTDCYGKIKFIASYDEEVTVHLFDRRTDERIDIVDWYFLKKDLVPYVPIKYDDLLEIEE